MPKWQLFKVAKQFHKNHTLAWVLFAVYCQNTFFQNTSGELPIRSELLLLGMNITFFKKNRKLFPHQFPSKTFTKLLLKMGLSQYFMRFFYCTFVESCLFIFHLKLFIVVSFVQKESM